MKVSMIKKVGLWMHAGSKQMTAKDRTNFR